MEYYGKPSPERMLWIYIAYILSLILIDMYRKIKDSGRGPSEAAIKAYMSFHGLQDVPAVENDRRHAIRTLQYEIHNNGKQPYIDLLESIAAAQIDDGTHQLVNWLCDDKKEMELLA